jgi:uncharacterized repeat protein (TIGR01451 family)
VVTVLRLSGVAGPHKLRTAILGSLVALIALLAGGVAVANTVTTNFEPSSGFVLGSVNGQGGWRSAPPGAIPNCNPTPTLGQYDQEVFANALLDPAGPAAFGLQSLRISNACANGEFSFQTYSAPAAPPAGETGPNSEFTAEFSFMSRTATVQPGLFLTVAPTSGDGSRMARVDLTDTPAGIEVGVADFPPAENDFVAHPLAVVARNVPHTIKLSIKLNPGPGNDLMRVAIDGQDVGQCFATWEQYYRTSPEQAPAGNQPPAIDSLIFRSSVSGYGGPPPPGGGYLFDNVSITTENGPGPPSCDTPIVKSADSATVKAGGRAGYRITVRNRGQLAARNIRVCDHVPRRMTFIGADHKLVRRGRQRCLLIPRLAPGQGVSFHLTLHVASNAPAGTIDNTADVTPVPPPDTPTPPDASADLPGPATPGTTVPPAKKARAKVKVLAERRARGRLPRFTG